MNWTEYVFHVRDVLDAYCSLLGKSEEPCAFKRFNNSNEIV
jgi:hypothetical protein